MNDFYISLEYLVLGTRLRRLSEAMLLDINTMYKSHHADFDAFWFPIFYILSTHEEVTNKMIKENLAISHSAVSQLLTNMQAKGLIDYVASATDGRTKTVVLTAKGRALLKKVQPLWNGLQTAIKNMVLENGDSKNILKAITALENSLKKNSLDQRVNSILKK